MKVQKKQTKNMQKAALDIKRTERVSINDAVKALKNAQFVRFDSTVEISIKLGIDPKQSSQAVRGVVSLPAGTGKSIKIAVICKDEDAAIAAGADLAGGVELINDIAAGNINFDLCIATPDMMGALGRVAKILGPKGLMPNPRLGTVTVDIAAAIKIAKAGQVEFRSDKGGNLNAPVGKLSFSDESLCGNIIALVDAIIKARPAGAKGEYIRSVFLSSTMSPSLRIDSVNLISQIKDSILVTTNLEKG